MIGGLRFANTGFRGKGLGVRLLLGMCHPAWILADDVTD